MTLEAIGLTVAVAVEDLDEILMLLSQVFDLQVLTREVVAEHGIEVARIELSENVELHIVKPLSTEGPIAEFVKQNGPGIHHFGLVVRSVSDAISHLSKLGIDTTSDSPQGGAASREVAFIHPRAAAGLRIELLSDSAHRPSAAEHGPNSGARPT